MEPSEFEAHCKSEKSHKQALEFTSFGDKAALSGSDNSTRTAAARINPNDGELDTLIVTKIYGDHGGSYHSMSLDRTGKSAPYDIDPSDKTNAMHSVLIYGEYLLSFLLNGPLCISKLGKNVYKGAHQINEDKCKHTHNGNNNNRNVQLEGDMLYFIDTNCHVVQYDLKELLSPQGTVNPNYKPTVHKTVCEDLCVSPNNAAITVITSNGQLSQLHNPSHTVDLQKLESGKLGTQYGTIETLGGYYVVASYNTATASIVYSVFSAQLAFLAFAAKHSPNQMVQNMLLYQRQDTLHILAANESNAVDILLFNDTKDKLKVHLIQSIAVGSHYLFGLVWRVESQEALLCGNPGVLKTLKLN